MEQEKHDPLEDVQRSRPSHPIEIHKVGVRAVPFPLTVMDKTQSVQHTVALINMYVDLPQHFRGTHMSRFIEILNEFRGMFVVRNIYAILRNMRKRLEAESAHLEATFSYFINRAAPVSQASGLMEFRCQFLASLDKHNHRDFVLGVEVPICTLCPCSKEISESSAHNQRGLVTARIRLQKLIWIEDLVEMIEAASSSKLYPILKREDEKFVTERAYENPKFVEDVAREVASRLELHPNIVSYQVESESYESIHSHNAYAQVVSSTWVAP